MITTIDLSGNWEFSFGEPRYDDTIPLPGTTAMAGKGELNQKEETGFLTERYPYEGKAYFAKNVRIPQEYIGKSIVLYMERTRMTRVWVDGKEIGTADSLTAPQEYEIGAYVTKEDTRIEIEVANCGYPTIGGHMTSPDTQTNWLGIMGRIALEIYDAVSVRGVHAVGDVREHTMELLCDIINLEKESVDCTFCICPKAIHLSGLIGPEGKNYDVAPETLTLQRDSLGEQTETVCVVPGKSQVRLVYRFEPETVLWSEYTPVVLQFDGKLQREGGIDEKFSFYAGLREFKAAEHDFLINGKVTKLRGKHDGMLFPMTGAAPMDLESWLRVMGTAWQYGINHYRYHTSCPPEAAFLAADLLGIYMEPELPFWGTVAAEGEEGYKQEEQEYLIQEGIRMLRAYGNHPSFCMMSMGNELWGSRERINEIMGILKSADNRPLYTQGSNNFQFVPEVLPEEDFFVGARLAPPDENGENKRLIRGSFAMCDAPLGPVQTMEPTTAYDFDEAILPGSTTVSGDDSVEQEDDTSGAEKEIAIQYGTGVKLVKAGGQENGVLPQVPVVSHEIGQYSMFPDFGEIEKYTGVLRAANMEIFRRRLSEAGMAERAPEFFRDAGHLAVACYREELEMMHRSRYIAGYQLLDIQDYTGQGTSLVGILNAFMESKGLVEPKTWRTFASDEVLLASFERYICCEGEPFVARVKLSFFNPMLSLEGKNVEWKISCGKQTVTEGELPIHEARLGTFTVGTISCTMPEYRALDGADIRTKQKLTFSLRIPGTRIDKEYTLWLYPAEQNITPQIPVTSDATEAWEILEQGGKVLFFPEQLKEKVTGFYCTDFWNYTMFRQISESMGRQVAVGTLGLSVQKEHPALAEFASETFSTPQWYPIVSNSDCAVLDERMPQKFVPIVQMIDNVERNHKLGILFEVAAGADGKLLVCTASRAALEKDPAGRQFLRSILDYAQSDIFTPTEQMTKEDFALCFNS